MFCHIIGFPLKKPRSVKLWTEFFKQKKININMSALEVHPNNFVKEITRLKKDNHFLGSAITMPYKEKIIKHVIYGNQISKYSKSINLIIKNKKSELVGYNTDVLGALKSLEKVKKKNIIIYGFGGTGKPLFYILKKKYKSSKFLIISSKKQVNIKKFKNVIVKKKIQKEDLFNLDLFINCSPLGSDLKKKFIKMSPLNRIHFKQINKKFFIFDIVYKPKKTLLNKICNDYGIKYLNGIKMNTIQAAEALKYISLKLKKIR